MLEAAISQASIIKCSELPEPWCDHGAMGLSYCRYGMKGAFNIRTFLNYHKKGTLIIYINMSNALSMTKLKNAFL